MNVSIVGKNVNNVHRTSNDGSGIFVHFVVTVDFKQNFDHTKNTLGLEVAFFPKKKDNRGSG